MLEMDAGPQKIAKGALMRKDIWEWLQVHWLHAQEMLQYCCQLKMILCWGHVWSMSTTAQGPGSPCAGVGQTEEEGGQSLGSLLHKAAPSLLLHTRSVGPILWLCSAGGSTQSKWWDRLSLWKAGAKAGVRGAIASILPLLGMQSPETGVRDT